MGERKCEHVEGTSKWICYREWTSTEIVKLAGGRWQRRENNWGWNGGSEFPRSEVTYIYVAEAARILSECGFDDGDLDHPDLLPFHIAD